MNLQQSEAEDGDAQPRPRVTPGGWMLRVLLGVIVLWVIGYLLLPSGGHPRSFADRLQSSNNLKYIGLALHNYHDTYRNLPPAFFPDEDGKPMHSWRVLILPLVEEEDLYQQYHFDKPWDAPENLKLVEQIPEVYTSPYDREQRKLGLTPYQAVSAPGTVMGTTRAARWDDLSRSNTPRIMVVADFDDPVPWTKPEDISPAEIIARIQQFKRHSPSRFHVLQSDGSVTPINDEMTVEELGKSF